MEENVKNLINKSVASLWAKKTVVDGDERWLPLFAHLIDTKNTINWLYNHWLSDHQKELLLINGDEERTQNLVKFLGFIHDIGKATPAFQTKKSYANSQSLDEDIIDKLLSGGFEQIDTVSLQNTKESPHTRAGEAILESYGLDKSIAAIIGGHHGKPESRMPNKQLRDYAANYWQTQLKSDAQERWKNVQKSLITYGLGILEVRSFDDVKPISQEQAVLLTGLVIMADWIASSEKLFPLIDINDNLTTIKFNRRYQQAISKWVNNNDIWDPEKVVDVEKLYQKRWGFSPRNVQKKMTEAIKKSDDPGIIIIEATPGIGKSEIAMSATEDLAARTGCTGFYMGLPTQATSNAMFSRIEQWLSKIGNEENKNLSIRLMHGKSQFNRDFTDLPKAENVDPDEINGSVVVNSWFTGKKSILDEFTVGTIDNLLLMALKQKHLFLKHLGLSSKVVVIDEVHAYDTYMTSYLDKALEWLGAYHIPVVVLSATLPKSRRNEFLKAYSLGKFNTKKFDAEDGWQQNQAYPLLSMLDGKKLVQIDDFEKQNSKKITIRRISDDGQNAVNLAVSKIKDGGIAGIIVNTVKRAQQLAQLVPADIPVKVLHSAFLAPDRSRLENELQQVIGKHADRPQKLIVIGTQVLEQSLDIDFDVLFTDIAPMDLIFQRIGRMHRHVINRPATLKNPELYVMGATTYGSYGGANESIYDKYILMKTDHYLRDYVTVPDDISPLVQAVYDASADYEDDQLSEAYEDFQQNYLISKKKSETFQIDKPRPKMTIHGWLDREQLGLDRDEIKAQAAVRDIKETIEVILLQQKNDEYYLLNGEPVAGLPDYEKEKIIAQQIIRLPEAVTPEWKLDSIIDQLKIATSKQFSDWQDSMWLKGSLALVINDQGTVKFNDWILTYTSHLGLSYEKETVK